MARTSGSAARVVDEIENQESRPAVFAGNLPFEQTSGTLHGHFHLTAVEKDRTARG